MRALLNGGNIHYFVAGNPDGLPVVFIHGFPFSLDMWRGQLDAVGAAGFRGIAFDIRGHGSSDVGDGQYTIESHVDDLFALLDHLKIPGAVIAGLSMGGYITLRALERDPGRFIAAILCDTRSEGDGNESRVKRAASAKGVKAGGSAAYADEYVKAMFTKETLAANSPPVGMIREIIAHTPPLSIAGSLLALAGRTDTTASLTAIRVPVLILVGEHDAVTPPSAAQSMHSKIPGAELHIIPHAAHLSNLENPVTFNEKLIAFLKRIPPVK